MVSRPPVSVSISQEEARRVALAAQGLDRSRPRRAPGPQQLTRLIRRLGLLQLDFVNVLVPAHYLVPFSRLGPYARGRLDDVVYRTRAFTERWAREASIVPVETWPLLRHRMERHVTRRGGFDRFIAANPRYLTRVRKELRERGPLCPEDLPEPRNGPPRAGGWSGGTGGWTLAKAVLEHLFGRGVVAVADRKPNFARVYDLAERLVPPEHLERKLDREDAERELLRLAARAAGIATAADLADDYRIPIREARPRLAELVEAKQLRELRVEGWREPAFLHAQAKLPGRVEAATLLSPFDPLIRHRDRAARLFDFDYRLEIFVPAAKRRWGYYVLPFLLGERLAARVDLKADRAAGALCVLSAQLEPGAEAGPVAAALAVELRLLGDWLGLDAIRVPARSGFGRALAAALR